MEKTFYAEGKNQEEFFKVINAWFSANRNIKVRKLYTARDTSVGLFVNKSNLSNITLIYDQDNSLNNLYGIDYLEKFSLMKISMDSMVESWKKSNPDRAAVTWTYSHNVRGQTGSLLLGGLGGSNRNQLWIIFKCKNLAPSPAPATVSAPAPATESPTTCPACQKAVSANAKFCSNCGQKL